MYSRIPQTKHPAISNSSRIQRILLCEPLITTKIQHDYKFLATFSNFKMISTYIRQKNTLILRDSHIYRRRTNLLTVIDDNLKIASVLYRTIKNFLNLHLQLNTLANLRPNSR